MPNKTLSTREDDLPLWERAERAAKTARTTVSRLTATALAEFLGTTNVCQVLMYEYTPETVSNTWSRNSSRRIEAFEGRWLTEAPTLASNEEMGYDRHGNRHQWSTHIAETVRGRIAVYARHYNLSYDEPPLFEVFEDITTAQQQLKDNPRVSQDTLQEVGYTLGHQGKRGEEIRWRDI